MKLYFKEHTCVVCKSGWVEKKLREKSRESHSHKPQLIPDAKRKRKKNRN